MNTPHNINVLIACEESQAECQAFRDKGFNAFSCDVQPCKKGGHKEWHIWSDVTPFLAGAVDFCTMDGLLHHVDRWHVIIAHPPCTYLCKVGSPHLITHGVINRERLSLMEQARDFFFKCLNAQADFVAVENPIPMARARLPRPSCYVQPSWYGHKYTKKTLYWLRNLPPLMPQLEYPNPKCFVTASRGKYRSRTFAGVAKAMAEQWGQWVMENIKI